MVIYKISLERSEMKDTLENNHIMRLLSKRKKIDVRSHSPRSDNIYCNICQKYSLNNSYQYCIIFNKTNICVIFTPHD